MSEQKFKYFQLSTKETPHQILSQDFNSHNWPISGGWGYTRETATVIDVDREGNGVAMEQVFLQYRTYEELIVFRPQEDRYSGIRFKQGKQSLMNIDGRMYDYVEYEISCFRDGDWNALKKEFEEHNGYKDDIRGLEEHIRRHDEKVIRFKTVCWFDITRFYGK